MSSTEEYQQSQFWEKDYPWINKLDLCNHYLFTGKITLEEAQEKYNLTKEELNNFKKLYE